MISSDERERERERERVFRMLMMVPRSHDVLSQK